MKIPRTLIEKIIREEIANRVNSLSEAGGEVVDADSDKKDKEKAGDSKAPKSDKKPPEKGTPPETQVANPDDGEKEDLESKADDEDAADETDSEEADAKKSISDELDGKTVQSITQEPKSKLVPGAQEIVVTFNEIPDPLRIIVTKSGEVKFFFKSLHNEI